MRSRRRRESTDPEADHWEAADGAPQGDESPGQALHQAFELVAASLGLRAARERYEARHDDQDLAAMAAVEAPFEELLASTVRDTPSGVIVELAQLCAISFELLADSEGVTPAEFLEGLRAMFFGEG